MSVKAILTEQQKSYTKAEEDALLAEKAAKKNGIYFGVCTTATNVSAKTVSISSFTNYYNRLHVRINFVYGQGASSPTLNINNLGAWPLSMHKQSSGIFDFVFNVTAEGSEQGIIEAQWEMVDDGIADSYGSYGKTTLSDDMSTNNEKAATPNAIKKAYDVLDTAINTINNSKVSANGLGKNLIRNWYFEGLGNGRGKFPINSRQIASGTNQTSGRWIDCWKGSMPTGINWSFTASGLSIANTRTTNYVYLQVLDNPNDILLGKQVTLSLLTTTKFYTATGYILSSYPSSSEGVMGGVQIGPAGQAYALLYMFPDRIEARFRVPEGVSYTMRAIKLELGDTQTLCHNEGTDNSPIWVLNEFPDYEYELYRCMTSTADPNDTYANKSLATEQQLAYVETGTTANRAYAVGDLFCWNGLLYRAKAAISSGAAFTPGTNCEQKIAFQTFADASTTVTDNTCVSSVNINKCESVGNIASIVATITLAGQVPTSRHSFGQLHNIPQPVQNVSALVQVNNYLFSVQITVDGIFCITSVGTASGASGWIVRVNVVYLTNGNIIS